MKPIIEKCECGSVMEPQHNIHTGDYDYNILVCPMCMNVKRTKATLLFDTFETVAMHERTNNPIKLEDEWEDQFVEDFDEYIHSYY